MPYLPIADYAIVGDASVLTLVHLALMVPPSTWPKLNATDVRIGRTPR